MGSNNAIGTGAVVLTANADALLAGLDQAQTKTEKWAKDTGKSAEKATGKGGGVFGTIFFGGKGGVGGGLSAGGFLGKGLVALGALGATLSGVTHIAEGFLGKLSEAGEISKKYSNVGFGRQAEIDRAQKGFDRIQAAADEFILSAAAKLAPTIEKIASGLEVVGFVGAEVFNEAVDLIGNIVQAISKWIDETFGLATQTTAAGDQVFAILRLVGKGFAYAWDVAKAGAGAVTIAVAAVASVLIDLEMSLIALAKELPETLKPDGFNEFIAGLERGAEKGKQWATDASKWGKGMAAGFGQSAQEVDTWFDKVQGKFSATDRLKKAFGNILSGAETFGSAGAYSIMAKFNAGNLVTGQAANDPVQIAKQGVGEQKKGNKLLSKVVGSLERGTVVQVLE